MHVAFADPPYPGQAAKHYADHPDFGGEVDHGQLLERLAEYDAWALSTASTTLQQVLRLPECPSDVRVAAWVKPFCSFKPNVNPAYAWEPVIWRGGRKRERSEQTVRDWTAVSITLRRGLVGAKPEAFAFWLFELLGMQADDELHDLFPGTGGVLAAWERWRTGLPLEPRRRERGRPLPLEEIADMVGEVSERQGGSHG